METFLKIYMALELRCCSGRSCDIPIVVSELSESYYCQGWLGDGSTNAVLIFGTRQVSSLLSSRPCPAPRPAPRRCSVHVVARDAMVLAGRCHACLGAQLSPGPNMLPPLPTSGPMSARLFIPSQEKTTVSAFPPHASLLQPVPEDRSGSPRLQVRARDIP
jgi:hypothetical protein